MITRQTRYVAPGALDTGIARSERPKTGRKLTGSLTFGLLCCLAFIAIGPVPILAQNAALRFDGGDVVIFGHVPALSNHTIEAWIKPVSTTTDQVIVGQLSGPGAACGFGTSLFIHNNVPTYDLDPAGCGTGNFIEAPAVVAGQWTHMAGTFDGSTGRLYLNGQLVAQQSNVSFDSSTYLAAGAVVFFNGPHPSYTGDLAEVRIWTQARTDQQIQSTMSCSLTGTETGLLGYWKMNEGTGQTVHDSSPNGFDGVLGNNGNVETSDPTWVTQGPPTTGTCSAVIDTFALKLTGTERCQNNPKFVEPIEVKAKDGLTFTITRDVLNTGDLTDIRATINNSDNATLDAITLNGRAFPKDTSGRKAKFVLSGRDPGNLDRFMTLHGTATFNQAGTLTNVTGTYVYQVLPGLAGAPGIDCLGRGMFVTINVTQ
jgi:hypothetical protein